MYKYLFTATFSDNFRYIQNLNDTSIYLENKSCFSDVLHLINNENKVLTVFTLNDSSYQNQYSVNLENGVIHIRTKDCSVDIPNPHQGLTNFRIIYFRSNVLNYNLGSEIDGKPTVKHFVLGWQATDSHGKNVQQTIEIH
jgi:hypothetical protein